MIKLNLFIGILVASSSVLAISCVSPRNEWAISPDKYVFIDHHINTYGECIEGDCQRLCIDFGTYHFDEAENTLNIYDWNVFNDLIDFRINSALKIVYGDGESLSGDAGMGAATGLSFVYKLPYKQGELEIVKVEPDGTAHIKYNEVSIILKSGEKWANTTTRVDTRQDSDGSFKLNLTITDTIINYGILDKSKIRQFGIFNI
ncbi:MAG: hypothetical protein A2025_03485 [Chloroflexi bacterium RBG_19FT_COMBO_47_15]|nr:MAG: hypothetical protein A2025_03485 [Chloroflexi bacterium RBG_19FT_COMBO_47_15]